MPSSTEIAPSPLAPRILNGGLILSIEIWLGGEAYGWAPGPGGDLFAACRQQLSGVARRTSRHWDDGWCAGDL